MRHSKRRTKRRQVNLSRRQRNLLGNYLLIFWGAAVIIAFVAWFVGGFKW